MSAPIPKSYHAIIKISKLILNTDEIITESHVNDIKIIIQNHLNSGMSPNDIKKYYSLEYTDFGMFIKKCLGIKIMSCKEAINNYNKKTGRSISDEKATYYKLCEFKFNPYSIPEIPGYESLITLGIYHPIKNPSGVCRDHIVSKSYGWRNHIDPNIISHPANCQFITNLENISKNDKSFITINDLEERIRNNSFQPISKTIVKLAKSKDHKNKISVTNSQYMTITNQVHNLRILKSEDIPDGYWRGITRKNKMVGAVGLEPTRN